MLVPEWHGLGKVQYEKLELYDMNWGNENPHFSEFHIAVCPFAGPIAMTKRKRKPKTKSYLKLFRANGNFITKISWSSNQATIVHFAWTEEMRILCLFSDGSAKSYSVFGELEGAFSILPPKATDRILNAEFWSAGLIALTEKGSLIQVTDLDTPRPRIALLSDTSSVLRNQTLSCMTILEPKFTEKGNAEVFLAMEKGSVLVASKGSILDLQAKDQLGSPTMAMAIAPNGMFMAVFGQNGVLTVLNTAFDKKILSFDTRSLGENEPPHQMLWCGEDAVLLYWPKTGIIVVGPFGSWIRFEYDSDEPLILMPEIDCCRVFSTRNLVILRRVSTAIETIRRVGSTASGAMLLDALESFDNGDAKADENIRCLQMENTLIDATNNCIVAAGDSWDPIDQRILLRAASYGRVFGMSNTKAEEENDEEWDSESFVECARILRVLNAMRTQEIAMPLTRIEYNRLSPEVVISRLVGMRHHFFALKICEYLKISSDRVLVHWACEKVKSSVALSDEQVVELVRGKLAGAKCVSYSEIASCAEKVSRRRLATLLLDLEELPADQVPLLLSMGEFELGLKKSIQSADTDLMYMALLHIDRTLNDIDQFKKVLFLDEEYKEAVSLMISYYKQTQSGKNKIEALRTDAAGVPSMDAADALVIAAYKSSSWESHMERIRLAGVRYHEAKGPLHAKCTEEQLELLDEQLKLNKSAGKKVQGLSLADTISKYVIDSKRDPKLASIPATLAKKFKLPEKCYYRIKIAAYAKSRQWEALYDFSKEKKTPPGGFKPFAIACHAAGEKRAAEEYVSRISGPDEKFETFVYMDNWKAALDVAFKQKDPEKLTTVRNQCNSPDIQKLVDSAAVQLGFVQ